MMADYVRLKAKLHLNTEQCMIRLSPSGDALACKVRAVLAQHKSMFDAVPLCRRALTAGARMVRSDPRVTHSGLKGLQSRSHTQPTSEQ